MSPITRDTVVVGVLPRINAIKFGEVLLAAGSPAFGEAYEMYQAAIDNGIDPAFFLAIFKQESTFATNPDSMVVIHNTHNPGNCRSSSIGPLPVIPTEKGPFVSYPDWKTGANDATHRLTDSRFPYDQAKANTIGEIIPFWAPSKDGNSPENYIANVVKFMNQWIGGESMPDLFPTAADLGLPANLVRIHKAADIGPWRPLGQVRWNIGHDTQGGAVGSEQTLTAQDSNIASCHAMIELDGTTVLMVPLDLTAWTPGNDYYAERSINIELVGMQTGPYTEAQYRSYAAYVSWAMGKGCPINNVYIGKSGADSGHLGHEDVPNPDQPGKFGGVSGHTDPGPLFDWAKLVQLCKGGSQPVTQPTKEPDVIFIPETGRSLGFGFKWFWEGLNRLGDNYNLLIMGYPVSNEFDIVFSADATTGKKHTVQLFQRSGLINENENPAPWDNHPMTLSQLMEAYDYAVANNLITADTRTAYMKWRDSNVERLTSWGEVLDNTFVKFGQDGGGYTTAELKTLHDMVVAMRAGQTFDQYQAAAAAQPH